jgi:hypothetical protein
MKKNLFVIVLMIFILSKISFSQEIDANVSVNMEQLTQEARIDVSTMESDLKRYINNQSFTDLDWEGPKIPVDLTIVLTGGNGSYAARMFIASKRYIYGQEGGTSVALKMVENNWAFQYQRGAMFSFNINRFDELSSIIDFYMLLVIGFDLDSYEELGGTRVFEIAKRISNLAANQNVPGFDRFTNPGQFSKVALLNELTDPRMEAFRKLIFEYYYDGLDMMTGDRDLAMETAAYIVYEMAEFKENKLMTPSLLLQVFFDSKYMELADLFKNYKDKESVKKDLMYLDPTHTEKYKEIMGE